MLNFWGTQTEHCTNPNLLFIPSDPLNERTFATREKKEEKKKLSWDVSGNHFLKPSNEGSNWLINFSKSKEAI